VKDLRGHAPGCGEQSIIVILCSIPQLCRYRAHEIENRLFYGLRSRRATTGS
jgi:hypothetical protein